jgi:hypothetical protein
MRTLLASLLLCCASSAQMTVQLVDFNGLPVMQWTNVQRVRWPTHAHLILWIGGHPLHVVVPPSLWVTWS